MHAGLLRLPSSTYRLPTSLSFLIPLVLTKREGLVAGGKRWKDGRDTSIKKAFQLKLFELEPWKGLEVLDKISQVLPALPKKIEPAHSG